MYYQIYIWEDRNFDHLTLFSFTTNYDIQIRLLQFSHVGQQSNMSADCNCNWKCFELWVWNKYMYVFYAKYNNLDKQQHLRIIFFIIVGCIVLVEFSTWGGLHQVLVLIIIYYFIIHTPVPLWIHLKIFTTVPITLRHWN